MQLTAREWIELIADPEIREKALMWVTVYPYDPKRIVENLHSALLFGITKFYMADDIAKDYDNLCANPPALLPFPNKEREAAEAVLKEFVSYMKSAYNNDLMSDREIADFLKYKYKS